MKFKGIFIIPLSSALILLSSCSALKYSDDPNYSICKQLERDIQFGGRTSYSPEVRNATTDIRRLQSTYDKMNCSKYQWLSF